MYCRLLPLSARVIRTIRETATAKCMPVCRSNDLGRDAFTGRRSRFKVSIIVRSRSDAWGSCASAYIPVVEVGRIPLVGAYHFVLGGTVYCPKLQCSCLLLYYYSTHSQQQASKQASKRTHSSAAAVVVVVVVLLACFLDELRVHAKAPRGWGLAAKVREFQSRPCSQLSTDDRSEFPT